MSGPLFWVYELWPALIAHLHHAGLGMGCPKSDLKVWVAHPIRIGCWEVLALEYVRPQHVVLIDRVR